MSKASVLELVSPGSSTGSPVLALLFVMKWLTVDYSVNNI